MEAEEKQWLGSLHSEWISQKGRYDSTSSKAEVFFQLLASLLQIYTGTPIKITTKPLKFNQLLPYVK